MRAPTPGGVEALHVLEGDGQVVGLDFQFGRQQGAQLGQVLGHEAVVVEVVDQEADHALVAIRQLHEPHLVQQVVAQLGGLGRHHRRIGVVVPVLAAEGAVAVVDRPVGVGRAALVAGVAGFVRCRRGGLGRGRRGGGRRGGVGHRRGAAFLLLVALEQRVFLQEGLDFLVQLKRRQLQQPDGLLQLGRQREVLGKLELKGMLHCPGSWEPIFVAARKNSLPRTARDEDGRQAVGTDIFAAFRILDAWVRRAVRAIVLPGFRA